MYKLNFANNPQSPADSVTFTEEILNGKLHFLCIARKDLRPRFFKFYRPGSQSLTLPPTKWLNSVKKFKNLLSILSKEDDPSN